MKKLMIALLMVVATSTASFAKGSNDNVQTAAKEVVQKVKDAPSGTTYGVVKVTKSHIVVNTPLGRYNINKNEDGSFGSNNIVVFLTIQYYCLSLRHE